MTEKHIKKHSTSLGIRELQIKTTLGVHHILVRMAKINYTRDSSCWQRCRARGILLHC